MPSTDTTTIAKEVEGVYEDFVKAVLSRDLVWLESNLADDFMLAIPSSGPDTSIGKKDYITQVRVLKGADIVLREMNVQSRGDWATLQFTADIMEELADSSELDAEAIKVRERSRVESFKEMLSVKTECYYTGVLRRRGDGWEVVLHSFFGPLDD
jgi:ketosteroid isomerase-like protein